MHALPVTFHLRSRTVLLVGGAGSLATDLRLILKTGAHVRVVAERLDADLEDAFRAGSGIWERRKFAPRDLHDAVLVLVATGNAECDRDVVRAARVARVPAAVPSRPELSDFELPTAHLGYRLRIALSLCLAGDRSDPPWAGVSERHADLGTNLTSRLNQPR